MAPMRRPHPGAGNYQLKQGVATAPGTARTGEAGLPAACNRDKARVRPAAWVPGVASLAAPSGTRLAQPKRQDALRLSPMELVTVTLSSSAELGLPSRIKQGLFCASLHYPGLLSQLRVPAGPSQGTHSPFLPATNPQCVSLSPCRPGTTRPWSSPSCRGQLLCALPLGSCGNQSSQYPPGPGDVTVGTRPSLPWGCW